MRAGDLRKRVLIEQRATTQDTFGEQVQTWTTFASAWAAIDPLSGREMLAAQAFNQEVTHSIEIRYISGVNARMRINYGGRLFNINAVLNENERNRKLVLTCSELLNDG